MPRVAISKVYLGPKRGRLSREKIKRYRLALRQGVVFPPIVVIKHRPGIYEVLDGFHRLHAHRREGRKTVLIEVLIGL